MKKLALLSFLALAGVFTGHQLAYAAAAIAPQPCDPQVYQQMKSRAWLEAEREIMQNQNLIFKPDSVLDYTCFNQFMNYTAGPIADIFTHTGAFGGIIVPPNETQDSLQAAVNAAYKLYRDEAFNHDLLGGRGVYVGLDPAKHPIDDVNRGASYTCEIMKNVWKKAKCLNFIEPVFADSDGFYPFETLECPDGAANCEPQEGYDVKQETRLYYEKCDTPGLAGRWFEEILNADNEGNILYEFQAPLGVVFEDVLERTIPGECTDAIPTGVQVVLETGPAHLDGVCTNPGCTYQASGVGALGDCVGGGAGGGGAGGGGGAPGGEGGSGGKEFGPLPTLQ